MDKKEKDFEDKFLNLDEVEPPSEIVKAKISKPKEKKKSLRFKGGKSQKTATRNWLIGLGVVLGTLLILVVASGVIKIPVLSQIVYGSPQPVRIVADVSAAEIDTAKNGVNFNPESGILEVKIAEDYLTRALRQYQSQVSQPQFAENIQVVIEAGQLEFYGTLLRPVQTELTLNFKPNLSKPSLTKFFKVTRLKIGNLRLPSIIAELALKEYLESKLKTLMAAFGGSAGLSFTNPAFNIRNIVLENGYVQIDIYIDQNRLEENLQQIPQFLEQFKNFAATKAEPILTPTSTQP